MEEILDLYKSMIKNIEKQYGDYQITFHSLEELKIFQKENGWLRRLQNEVYENTLHFRFPDGY